MNASPVTLISCLDKHVVSGPVGTRSAPGRWRAVPYRTDAFEGVFLGCGHATKPLPVTLRLGVRGPHRIWLGLYGASRTGCIRVRLTRDLCCRTFVTPPYGILDPPDSMPLPVGALPRRPGGLSPDDALFP